MNSNFLIPNSIDSNQNWGQLQGSSLSLALTEFCENKPGVKLIITPDNFTANQLLDEISFFSNKTKSNQNLLCFPDWETLPYDHFSPHQDIISERLSVLSRLGQMKNAVVISAFSTLMHRLCPLDFIKQHAFVLNENDNLDINSFRQQLQQAGYYAVNKVLEHGEFAIRGSIIDLFPMGSSLPYRIELFDDTVESLRLFDVDSQRTIEKIPYIHILPAREFPLNDSSISQFRRSFREQFSGNPSLCSIYESITKGQSPNGIEYYLPLFFDKTATFFDYLPKNTSICLIDSIDDHANTFWKELEIRFEQRRHDVTRPVLSPIQCYLSTIEFMTWTKQFDRLRLYRSFIEKKSVTYNFNTKPGIPLLIDRHNALAPLSRLADFISHDEQRILLVVESAGRREVLIELLKQSNIIPTLQQSWSDFVQSSDTINIIVGPISEGVSLVDNRICLIVESQLFGEQSVPHKRSISKSIDTNAIIRDLAEIRIGTPVVHLQFGVGRYLGLEIINNLGQENEFLVLAYAENDKIYVPVTSLHLISRYTGSDPEYAPLHRLGSDQWQREKKKAAEKIHDTAIELLDIYAKREAKPGHVYQVEANDYASFVSAFPFEETLDQQQAIEQILQDMASSRPMDRLICGDVGFGKTEVAMRAAFIAVQNGKQVCVLVPTTLLAGQHFETFRDRFADFPFRIELLSRFRSQKESNQVIESLHNGRIDIVIGTHKLFQKDISFHNLGLLIIDEEHRFGVKQKEHIKSLRTHIDILSMTATPIPRTLNMAMSGIRDISLIATAPAKRLAIKTFWQEKNNYVLREAILREILRGGQVFFLHNNVQTIQTVRDELIALVPEANIQIAHGQMRERDLERIMSDFYHHRFNVLVCTTIVETGIDIPTANTIIIDRADKFGLAQLHQLRGRVGRSHHQAYAYLLTPDRKLLSNDALKRLEAIVSLEDLGAGFTLATHDLEIRGAGELLGEGQSGNLHAIGFNLFMEMLDKAVNDLKSGKTPVLDAPLNPGPEIDLHLSAIIPSNFINDIHTRLIFYKRISNASASEELKELQIEMIDRFGLLPTTVKQLFGIMELKFLATRLGILKIQANSKSGYLVFNGNPTINSEVLINLIQVHSKIYKLDGPTKLQFLLNDELNEARIATIHALLLKLLP